MRLLLDAVTGRPVGSIMMTETQLRECLEDYPHGILIGLLPVYGTEIRRTVPVTRRVKIQSERVQQ